MKTSSNVRPVFSGMILAATAAVVASTFAPSIASAAPAECEATASNLGDAKDEYAAKCPTLPRADCDPMMGGWVCASYRMPRLNMPEINIPEPVVVPEAPAGLGECTYLARTISEARAGHAMTCALPAADCDPVAGGWQCSTEVIGTSAPGRRASVAPSRPAPVVVTPQPTPTPTPAPVVVAPKPEPVAVSHFRRLSGTYTGRKPGGRSWADSYSIGGVCYIQTNWDHGAANLRVTDPQGFSVSARSAATRIEKGPGIQFADALFNDIRCGNGPANSAGDEDPDQCPGRVDQGRDGCRVIGPDWKWID